MGDAPERIWLLSFDGEQRTWCDQPDPSGLGHEDEADGYLRADIAAREVDLRAEVERLKAERDAVIAATASAKRDADDAMKSADDIKTEAHRVMGVWSDRVGEAEAEAARLRGLLDEALAALIEIGSHGSKHVAYGDVAMASRAIARITAKIGDLHD